MADLPPLPATSLFTVVDHDAFLPTVLARGPWDERFLHGGPPAALFAHVIESLADDVGSDWMVARLTVELERSVPVEPLALRTEVLRPGRKVSLVEATMTVASTGAVLARARALRIRQSDDVVLPHHDDELAPLLAREVAPLGPEDGSTIGSMSTDYAGFHNVATEHRFVGGSWDQLGPVTDWIRLRVPLLPGVTLTPLQRVAAAVDFANGISRVLSFESHLFINPDLTIHLFQEPEGEWIGVDSATHHGPRGVGLSDTAIYDVHGRVGRSNQSLLLDAR